MFSVVPLVRRCKSAMCRICFLLSGLGSPARALLLLVLARASSESDFPSPSGTVQAPPFWKEEKGILCHVLSQDNSL